MYNIEKHASFADLSCSTESLDTTPDSWKPFAVHHAVISMMNPAKFYGDINSINSK